MTETFNFLISNQSKQAPCQKLLCLNRCPGCLTVISGIVLAWRKCFYRCQLLFHKTLHQLSKHFRGANIRFFQFFFKKLFLSNCMRKQSRGSLECFANTPLFEEPWFIFLKNWGSILKRRFFESQELFKKTRYSFGAIV